MEIKERNVLRYFANLKTVHDAVATENFIKQSSIAAHCHVDANLVTFLVHNNIVRRNEQGIFIWDERIPVTETLARTACVRIRERYRLSAESGSKLQKRSHYEMPSEQVSELVGTDDAFKGYWTELAFAVGLLSGLIAGVILTLIFIN
jgi:hypothetical protein